MKKYSLFLILFILGISSYAQGFDDMIEANPDMMTFFQNEMTSLMQFQLNHNMNIPLFASAIMKLSESKYHRDYMLNFYENYIDNFHNGTFINFSSGTKSFDYYGIPQEGIGSYELNFIGGFQFKINNFYIPIFYAHTEPYIYTLVSSMKIVDSSGTVMYVPATSRTHSQQDFFGAGFVIDTDKLKGGIYMGYYHDRIYNMGSEWNIETGTIIHGGTRITFPSNLIPKNTIIDIYDENNNLLYKGLKVNKDGEVYPEYEKPFPFKIALVPLIKTSEWGIGKVLNSILGYLGTGDNVIYYKETDEDSKWNSLASVLNLGLNLTFNRISLDSLNLNIQTIYSRTAYDAAAKNDTFGVKIAGLFSGFPFGFSLEGGYKHFVYIAPFFSQVYSNTGYFDGSIYFPFKRLTLSALYKYDIIKQHQFGIVLSTNFLSGQLLMGISDSSEKQTYSGDFGARFKWGGWKVNKN